MNKLLTIGCAAATFAALVAGPTTNASAYAPCGTTVNDKDGSAWPKAVTSAAKIRTGSDINCTAVGSLLEGQRADYHCYSVDLSTGLSWTYLRDVATGKTGWVRDDLLPGNGSHVYCGF
jgi:hypothetical protein